MAHKFRTGKHTNTLIQNAYNGISQPHNRLWWQNNVIVNYAGYMYITGTLVNTTGFV